MPSSDYAPSTVDTFRTADILKSVTRLVPCSDYAPSTANTFRAAIISK